MGTIWLYCALRFYLSTSIHEVSARYCRQISCHNGKLAKAMRVLGSSHNASLYHSILLLSPSQSPFISAYRYLLHVFSLSSHTPSPFISHFLPFHPSSVSISVTLYVCLPVLVTCILFVFTHPLPLYFTLSTIPPYIFLHFIYPLFAYLLHVFSLSSHTPSPFISHFLPFHPTSFSTSFTLCLLVTCILSVFTPPLAFISPSLPFHPSSVSISVNPLSLPTCYMYSLSSLPPPTLSFYFPLYVTLSSFVIFTGQN